MGEIYRVEIVETDTGNVVKSLTAHGERAAEKLENGAMRNLNHNKYFTRIVPFDAAEIGKAMAPGAEGG